MKLLQGQECNVQSRNLLQKLTIDLKVQFLCFQDQHLKKKGAQFEKGSKSGNIFNATLNPLWLMLRDT